MKHIKTVTVDRDKFNIYRIEPDSIDATSLEDIGLLRHLVWRDLGMDMTSSIKSYSWIEPIDYDAYHWIVYKEQQVVSSARLTLHKTIDTLPESALYKKHQHEFPGPIASFNRLVVKNEFRNRKLSSQLDQLRIEQSVNIGAKSIALDCPEFRVNSLIKKGFKLIDGPVDGVKCPSKKWYILCKLL